MDKITTGLLIAGALFLAWNNRAWLKTKIVNAFKEEEKESLDRDVKVDGRIEAKELAVYQCVRAYNVLANHHPEARSVLEKHIWPLMVPGDHDEKE